jgi:uncharacterized protein YecE (DUF72 family)
VRAQGLTHIGTAGWSIPRASWHRCPPDGTHLQRYACVFNGVEINSSFYGPHATPTYARWAASTPEGFRFAVKVPKLITHELRLRRARAPFEQFLSETAGLGNRRGPLLVQLPPSFGFEERVAARFFAMVRERFDGFVVFEPRHPTWFTERAERLLCRHSIARVAADPAVIPAAGLPGGWPGCQYFRLHGSPRMYWSSYDTAYLTDLTTRVRKAGESSEVWCVFDNTALGAAIENAWELQRNVRNVTE